jgi:ubiquinone/menaquinone biosynthesis C-methylase UbiE
MSGLRCLSPFILLCLAGVAPAGERSFEFEAWEQRINARQPPEAVMKAIGLEPGMVVGEIGAGGGRMTVRLADRVGPGGKVYANDIDEEALEKLARRCEKEGLANVEIIVGKVMDPLLPAGTLDMVFMINVFHHAEDPVALVRNAIPALKPGGTLAIVECDPDKTGWDDHGCTGLEEMPPQLERAGYEMVRVETFLEQDNIFIARPREAGASR